MRRRRCVSLIVWLGLMLLAAPESRAEDRSADDFFEAEIRPLLVEKCQSCHGDEKPKGGLSLTSRAAILAGGDAGPAAVEHEPIESLLIEVVGYESEPRMPPKGKLSDAEIDALTRWIELGLPWPGSEEEPASPPKAEAETASSIAALKEQHWAFQPLQAVEPPEVGDDSASLWPIDRFILEKLEAKGLSLSPEADRRRLIRRLSFNLTGLPPTPEEVDAFVNDPAPDAYERLVDRLLASPHYGEQWARHWLDVARYSDTKGYVYGREENSWVHAWVYRDWVVRALNNDLPYNRFLLLQLAADQVAEDPSDLAAMGFLTLGRRFLGVSHDIIDDRIDVVTRGMLGLTVTCARCHDHKFDPIPTADYYSLYGVFRSCSERLVPAAEMPDPSSGDAMAAFLEGLQERQRKLDERLDAERAAAAKRARDRVTEYLLAQFELSKYPDEVFSQILYEKDLIPWTVHAWRDAIALAGERGDPVFRAWHDLVGLRKDAFPDQAEEVSRALAEAPAEVVNPVVAQAFAEPVTEPREVAERYGALFEDVIERWETLLAEAKAEDRPAPEGLPDPNLEAIRQVLYGPGSPCEVPDEPIVNIEFYFPTGVTTAIWNLQNEVDRWLMQSPEAPPHAVILVDRDEPVEPQILRRGNPANRGDRVPRRFLQVLSEPDDKPFENGSGRLELAREIIDPANPLTARVIVNRVWMLHFGEGLVRTPSDFGTRADPPSHPELLDWLASNFIAEGWSLKWLHRQILLSSTYRQSAAGPADPAQFRKAMEVDPENRLLWRMSIRRLTFEQLRDALLAVTGELDPRIGGKSTNLFDTSDATRRALYGRIDRQDLPSVLRIFDFANPDLLTPRRSEATIPQQALYFLNSPFLLERIAVLAERAQADSESDEERVRQLYRLVFQREPTPSQLDAALALVQATPSEEPTAEAPSTIDDWQYGYGRFDEESGKVVDFQPLPHFAGDAWQGGPSWPDAQLGWARLTPDGGHPGNDLDHAVVRRWIAPRDMTIQVRSTLIHEVPQGDGIRGFLSGSRLGTLQAVELHNDRADLNAEALDVKAGDTIDFVVDIRQGLNSDQFHWAPVVSEIREASGPEPLTTWDAQADFGAEPPIQLGPWEQLAQVLLMTNEFSFIE